MDQRCALEPVVCVPSSLSSRGGLFDLAYACAERGERVSYVCPEPTADEAQVLFAHERRDPGVLQQIQMSYIPSCAALQCYLSCVQLLAEPPDILIVAGYFEEAGAHSVAHAQWLNTLAAASDAARFLRKSRDNFCIALGADGAVCQGNASPTARMFARHAKLAVLGAGGTLVTTHRTRSYMY